MKTDDVLKALEICACVMGCVDCPYFSTPNKACVDSLLSDLHDLFNHQKAEIEFLKHENENLSEVNNNLNYQVDVWNPNESIKEFADRLKEKAKMPLGTLYGQMVYAKDIDNLVKEMTGDHDA